jgi:glycosyltransferase involved in cell wall biosynthesis
VKGAVELPVTREVSVVIPVFNAAPLVARALQSVFSQTFSDFEVIVIDDGSEDEAALRTALQPWAARIRYVRQANGGPASARNTGIAHATGRLLAFLDADDEWRPEKLALQIAYFRQYPETGLLHTAISGEVRPPASLTGPPRARFCELFHSDFFINTLTVMVPRQVITEVGGFDERREIHIEDYDLWLRIAARYPIGYIPEPLAYHRPGGLMSSQMERTYAAQALVMEKNEPLCLAACAAHRASPSRCKRARRHVLHRDWGYDRLQTGDSRGAREQLRQAVACSPFDTRTIALYLATFLNRGWLARMRRLFRRRPVITRGEGARA